MNITIETEPNVAVFVHSESAPGKLWLRNGDWHDQMWRVRDTITQAKGDDPDKAAAIDDYLQHLDDIILAVEKEIPKSRRNKEVRRFLDRTDLLKCDAARQKKEHLKKENADEKAKAAADLKAKEEVEAEARRQKKTYYVTVLMQDDSVLTDTPCASLGEASIYFRNLKKSFESSRCAFRIRLTSECVACLTTIEDEYPGWKRESLFGVIRRLLNEEIK